MRYGDKFSFSKFTYKWGSRSDVILRFRIDPVPCSQNKNMCCHYGIQCASEKRAYFDVDHSLYSRTKRFKSICMVNGIHNPRQDRRCWKRSKKRTQWM